MDASEEELLKSAAFSDMEVHFLEGTGSAETGRKKLSVSCVPEKANLLIQLVVPKSESFFLPVSALPVPSRKCKMCIRDSLYWDSRFS